MKIKVLSSVFLLGLFAFSPVVGASTCKGLSKSSCEAKSTCSYVKSFKRKDGASVKAHCRTIAKSKKKSKTDKAAVKKVKSMTKTSKTSKTSSTTK